MTAAILVSVWVLWPVLALTGAAFAPLAGLLALAAAPLAIPRIRLRFYMLPVAAFFIYAAVSSLWSPAPHPVGEMGFFDRREFKTALLFLAFPVLFAAVTRLDFKGRALVLRGAQIGLIVQFVVVAILAVFETQILELLSFAMPGADEGVQNISRNSLILAAAAPFLIQSVTENRTPRMAIVLALVILLAVAGVCLMRGVNGGAFAMMSAALAIGVIAIWRRSGFRILAFGIALLIWTAPMLFGLMSLGADASKVTTSSGYRLAIWQRVIELIGERPIEGHGLGVLRTMRDTISGGTFDGQLIIPNHAHNALLQLWAEMGAIGAGLLAFAVVLAGWRLPAPERLGLAAPRVAGLAGGAMAIACVSFDLWNEWWWAVAGFLALLAAVVARENDLLTAARIAGQRVLEAPRTQPRIGVSP